MNEVYGRCEKCGASLTSDHVMNGCGFAASLSQPARSFTAEEVREILVEMEAKSMNVGIWDIINTDPFMHTGVLIGDIRSIFSKRGIDLT